MGKVGIILLAAGNSSRMGRLKQLLPFRGTTLLRHACVVAIATEFTPVIVVLGAESELCQAEIDDLPLVSILNAHWEEGMGSSVRAGVAELLRIAPEIEGVLILLHDQPLISTERLRGLVGALAPENCAVAAVYGGTIGVPAFFARELFNELTASAGNQGAKLVLEAHRQRVREFDMPEALADVDTPLDYERFK